MISKLKEMVKFTDMFYSSEMLRHEDEQEYRTITGGLLSLAIIITTIVGFASMILETLDRSNITTSTQIIKNVDPTLSTFTASSDQHFMFAVQVWRVNITGPQRYFDVTLSQQLGAGQVINVTYLPLQPCTRQHWALIPSLSDNFDMLNIGNWVCPPMGFNFSLSGKYSSSIYSSYALTVEGCKNQTDPSHPCASQQKIDELFSSFSNTFYFTLYITNPTINPDSKEYKSYYLQDENYVLFGDRVGSIAYLFFSDYTIDTDYSIWPFKDIVTDHGIILENLAINHPIQTSKEGVLAQIYFAKSPNYIKYTRQVQKITSVFSFIGGMISAASAILFFVKIYTNLSYEISIAISIFEPNKQTQANYLQMNFLTFIQYQLYKFSQKIGFKLNWPEMEYFCECQAEIVKHLDINKIVKQFIFFEHCLTFLFEDYQLYGLQMKIPTTLNQIKSIRQKCAWISEQGKDDEQPNKSNLSQKIAQVNQVSKNAELPASPPLQSNMQFYRTEGKRYYQHPNLIIQDVGDQSISKKSSLADVISTKKKTINSKNAVSNDFSSGQSRQKYLYLLKLNSEKGDEISKKIWQSLPNQIKEKVQQQQILDRIERGKQLYRS